MDTAPKDSEQMLRLLVRFTENPTEDAEEAWTVGAWSGEKWQFAGWNWCQDRFTEGAGEVLGWLPMHTERPEITTEMVRNAACAAYINNRIDHWRGPIDRLALPLHEKRRLAVIDFESIEEDDAIFENTRVALEAAFDLLWRDDDAMDDEVMAHIKEKFG
jgi:hypothetical protein